MAVTVVISAYAWSLGWRGSAFALLVAVLLVGQLSVGWSNDAFDARRDASAGRAGKPTVIGLVSARTLWLAAALALASSAVSSWIVAGAVGGSFHVLALIMAWLYNVAVSRTIWSWVPYAIAFGAMPAFLYLGLDGSAPPAWAIAVFAIVGVSAHLANALPDIDADRRIGVGGLAVRLGAGRGLAACWLLLAVGSAILVAVTVADRPVVAATVAAAYVVALAVTLLVRRQSASFRAVLVVVAVDVVALVLAGSGGAP